jgi:hypothetical protein
MRILTKTKTKRVNKVKTSGTKHQTIDGTMHPTAAHDFKNDDKLTEYNIPPPQNQMNSKDFSYSFDWPAEILA